MRQVGTYALWWLILPLSVGHACDRRVFGLRKKLVFAADARINDVAAKLRRVVNAHRVLHIRRLTAIDRFSIVK